MQGNCKVKEDKGNHFFKFVPDSFKRQLGMQQKWSKAKEPARLYLLSTLCLLGIDIFYIFVSFLKTIV